MYEEKKTIRQNGKEFCPFCTNLIKIGATVCLDCKAMKTEVESNLWLMGVVMPIGPIAFFITIADLADGTGLAWMFLGPLFGYLVYKSFRTEVVWRRRW